MPNPLAEVLRVLSHDVVEVVPKNCWARQFKVQGSKGSEYTVSYLAPTQHATEHWGCGCMAKVMLERRGRPHEPCKHIVHVQTLVRVHAVEPQGKVAKVARVMTEIETTGRRFR